MAVLWAAIISVAVFRLNDRVSYKQDLLTPSVFTVEAGSVFSVPFNVNKPGHVLGRFEATGGSDNDIEAVIADADDFENWKSGHPARLRYQSAKITTGRIDISLKRGRYYLAFDNRFSPLTGKTITANILLDQ
jgi:hypothetical protein